MAIERSMEQLFKEHYAALCYFASKIIGDSKLGEDVVQDAFMVYWEKKKEVGIEDYAIKYFLYSTVKFKCYNWVRREKVVQKYHHLNNPELIEESVVLKNIIQAEVLDAIYKIMETLPQGCQMVFRLGYLEGLSNIEISKRLEISINTVKTQKQRGLRVIKEKLNPELFSLLLVTIIDQYQN